MVKPTNKLLSDEEIKEKLIQIYNDINSGEMSYNEIKKKYDISKFAISDLKDMKKNEFDRFLNEILDIKRGVQKGKKVSKISAELGYGSCIVGYIVKSTCNGYEGTSKDTEAIAFRKQTERIWKQYKKGETIENLSYQYGINEEELEFMINYFDINLKNKITYYRKIKSIGHDSEKIRLKERFNFDDDTIEYVLEGKEIGTVKDNREVEIDEQ